jgi:hypothetical protein
MFPPKKTSALEKQKNTMCVGYKTSVGLRP